MTHGKLGLGLAFFAIVTIPATGLTQQVLPSPVLPGTLVPRLSPPAQLSEPPPQPEQQQTIPANAAEPNQLPIPDASQDKKEATPNLARIREPGERFQRPEGEPGFQEAAFGKGHWH